MKFLIKVFLLTFLSFTCLLYSVTNHYNLVLEESIVNYSGNDTSAMTVNGGIPGPTLRFTEGDWAEIVVSNKMTVESSIHWHGILLPNDQDGVPYLTTPPIEAGKSLTFRFQLTHSGTYWYHSHTGLQEQKGVYGSIVIEPKDKKDNMKEYVLLFSDWIDEDSHSVVRTLKRGSEYYSIKRKSLQNVLGAVKNRSLSKYFKQSWKRMPSMDISDIAYDEFLVNGKKSIQLDGLPGEKIKLRIINASASTYFYMQFAGGDMQIVAADGGDVQPVSVSRLLMAVAETYDVVITVPNDGSSYEFRATSQDGFGLTSAIIGNGKRISAPDVPRPNMYKMDMTDMDMSKMKMNKMIKKKSMPRPMPPYQKLKSVEKSSFDKKPDRTIVLNVTGDMERYVWSFNNKTLKESDNIKIKKGEVVKIVFDNKTMMHHPMHLHGHFFRVINKNGDYSPWKHTVDVAPLQKTTIEFLADEEKDWFLHCHILYHMKAGMARIVSYEGSSPDQSILDWRKSPKNFLLKDPMYVWSSFSFMQSFLNSYWSYGNFDLTIANTRNIIELNARGGWEWSDSVWDLEATAFYNRYFNRYFRIHAGVRYEGDKDIYFLGGFQYLLPLRIEFKMSLLHNLNLLFEMGKDIVLTTHFHLYGDVEYTLDYKTAGEMQWTVGAQYILGKNITAKIEYDSTYLLGAGINVLF